MSTLYVIEDGAVVRKDGDQLKLFSAKDGLLLQIPLTQVEQLVLMGNVTVTAPVVRALLDRGVGLAYMTGDGRFLGRLQPPESKNVPLRWNQFQFAADPSRQVQIARAMVRGKVLNQRTLLQRAAREGVSDLGEAIDHLRALVERLDRAVTVDEVRGVEGAAAAAYFREWPKLIRVLGFPFPGRVRRPPTDPVNALLSLGAVLLLNEVLSACQVVGFDPYVGYLHMDRYGRPALALDLMEEFRPVFVDATVLAFINRRMVEPEDFDTVVGGGRRLKPHALKKFLGAWEEKKRTVVRHPVLGWEVPYWRVIELQARVLAKVLLGEAEEYVPYLTR